MMMSQTGHRMASVKHPTDSMSCTVSLCEPSGCNRVLSLGSVSRATNSHSDALAKAANHAQVGLLAIARE